MMGCRLTSALSFVSGALLTEVSSFLSGALLIVAVFAPAYRGYLRPSAAGSIALSKGVSTDYLGLQATYLRPPNAQKNKKLLEAMGHE